MEHGCHIDSLITGSSSATIRCEKGDIDEGSDGERGEEACASWYCLLGLLKAGNSL